MRGRRRHVEVKPLLSKSRTRAELFFLAMPFEILQAESVQLVNYLQDLQAEPERISVKYKTKQDAAMSRN